MDAHLFDTEHAARQELVSKALLELNNLIKGLKDTDLSTIDFFSLSSRINSIVTGQEAKAGSADLGIYYVIFGAPFLIWQRLKNGESVLNEVGRNLINNYLTKKMDMVEFNRRLVRLIIATHYFEDGNGRTSRTVSALFQKLLNEQSEFNESEVVAILGVNKVATTRKAEGARQPDEENHRQYNELSTAFTSFIRLYHPEINLQNFLKDLAIPESLLKSILVFQKSKTSIDNKVHSILSDEKVKQLNFEERRKKKWDKVKSNPLFKLMARGDEENKTEKALDDIIESLIQSSVLKNALAEISSMDEDDLTKEQLQEYVIRGMLLTQLNSTDMQDPGGIRAASSNPNDMVRYELDYDEVSMLVQLLKNELITTQSAETSIEEIKDKFKNSFVKYYVLEF